MALRHNLAPATFIAVFLDTLILPFILDGQNSRGSGRFHVVSSLSDFPCADLPAIPFPALARDGVSREVLCSALKGETVPDSQTGSFPNPSGIHLCSSLLFPRPSTPASSTLDTRGDSSVRPPHRPKTSGLGGQYSLHPQWAGRHIALGAPSRAGGQPSAGPL